MRRAERDRVRALLDERRAASRARGAAVDAEIAALADAREAANADDEHDPEGATVSGEWSRLAGLRAGVDRDLREIDAAIAAADAHGFGICTGCGRDIPFERLLVRPSATMCVACATRAGR